MARTHPGETVSNFALENLVVKILSSEKLKERYDFYIVPMVNPDGVYLGNHRTGALGMDFNRCFHSCDPEVFPEVSLIINEIARLRKVKDIKFLIDLHGHSAKRNIFAYGE